MEYLVIILLAVSFVQVVVQYSLIEKLAGLLIIIVVWSFVCYQMHGKAIEQSYATFQNQLSDTVLMVNLAVLQVVEAVLGILMSLSLLKIRMGAQARRGIVFLKNIPGIVGFIALLYAESFLFLQIHIGSFSRLAIILALGFGILLLVFVKGLRWLIPEFELRCEIKFLLHVVQIILASTIYISISGLKVAMLPEYGSLKNLFLVSMLFCVATSFGFLLYAIKMRRLRKKININDTKNQ